MSECQTKAGNQISLSHSHSLSFTHSRHTEQLLFSCLCSKVTLSLSHYLTLSMSHSHSFTLSFTHSPHAEQLLISWEWLLSIDMKTKDVQYDMRDWETALQPCNLFIFQQNFEALGVVFHPPPQNVKLGSGVKLLKSFGLIQIGLLCDELWP